MLFLPKNVPETPIKTTENRGPVPEGDDPFNHAQLEKGRAQRHCSNGYIIAYPFNVSSDTSSDNSVGSRTSGEGSEHHVIP